MGSFPRTWQGWRGSRRRLCGACVCAAHTFPPLFRPERSFGEAAIGAVCSRACGSAQVHNVGKREGEGSGHSHPALALGQGGDAERPGFVVCDSHGPAGAWGQIPEDRGGTWNYGKTCFSEEVGPQPSGLTGKAAPFGEVETRLSLPRLSLHVLQPASCCKNHRL